MTILDSYRMSRRGLLRGGSAAAAAVSLGLTSVPALAKGPMQTDQAPTYYRFKLGNAEATIVSDGRLPLGDPHTVFLGPSANELDAMLTNNFLPTKSTPVEQNTLVLNTGDRIIIFDNGMGISR